MLENRVDRLGDAETIFPIAVDFRGLGGKGRVEKLNEGAHHQTADTGPCPGMAVDLAIAADLGVDGPKERDAEWRQAASARCWRGC